MDAAINRDRLTFELAILGLIRPVHKKPKRFLLQITNSWLILLLLATGHACANTEPTFAHGLLFRIEQPGIPPSYIFGTIHSEDPRVLSLPKSVSSAFDRADTLVLELDLKPATLQASIAGMFLQDGRELHGIIGAKLYEQAVNFITDSGIPEEAIRKFKPWGIVMLLSMPPTKTGQFLDLTLYQSAIAQNKNTQGLETVEEQLAVFDQLPEINQIAMLRNTLKHRPQFEQMFEELLAAYLKRELGTLVQLSQKYGPTDIDTARRLEERLVTKRNLLMANRMNPILKQGNSFIAIGALHLPGPKGVLNLLQQQGFQVTVEY